MPRPLLLSTSICLMDHEVWIVVHAYYQLFIHSVILIECVVTLMIPSGHMTSVHHGEGSSSVALRKVPSLFSPVNRFFGSCP